MLPHPNTHHHIAKGWCMRGLCATVPFTWYIMSGYQEKVTRDTKKATQFEERPMARLLELSTRELKTLSNMVWAPMDTVDIRQEWIDK